MIQLNIMVRNSLGISLPSAFVDKMILPVLYVKLVSIPFLHVTAELRRTSPGYSGLRTTCPYLYNHLIRVKGVVEN